ncbi:MAGE family-domain-containing protein [Sordaria brevicollis]|uniref:MAGE family-domain-containing protein n=1 Tax=Sordaria brevicollis TaxID=83679 RepID=A0AAE0PA10_SORBR|nr:MAGE family-domain-containing protein [Sordaria brevicollis]
MPPTQRRRRQAVDSDEDEDVHQRPDSNENSDVDMHNVERDETSQLIKKLVRYALACEYSRTPIRRDGIKERVLGIHGREFKKVFAGAQKQLRAIFGMEMVELPTRDRSLLTVEQKRKATKSQSQKEPTSNAYILVSVLPEHLRVPDIITPSKVQSADGEAAYVGLYTMLIAIITLSGGELSDPRLRRYLTRLNAAENMPSSNPNSEHAPSEKTELVLQRMIKQGYLVKVADNKNAGDDDAITWHVGPRGKMEVDNEAIAAVVREIYGGSRQNKDLERKLQASLKVKERKPPRPAGESRGPATIQEDEEEEEEEEEPEPGPSTRRGRRG